MGPTPYPFPIVNHSPLPLIGFKVIKVVDPGFQTIELWLLSPKLQQPQTFTFSKMGASMMMFSILNSFFDRLLADSSEAGHVTLHHHHHRYYNRLHHS